MSAVALTGVGHGSTAALGGRPTGRRRRWGLVATHRAGAGAAVLLLGIVALCALAPWLAPEGYAGGALEDALAPPSLGHLLGTDALGRDILARLLYAGRISLAVAGGVGLLTTTVGALVGLTAGYRRGLFEAVSMRVVDACLAVPRLPLYLVLLRLLGPGAGTLVVVLSLFEWTLVARLAYAGTLGESGRLYVTAARALGAPGWRIALYHVLLNVLPPIIVAATLGLRGLILAEASLSFLGFGILPPVPTWGNMLQGVQSQLWSRPWLAVYPGAAIFLTTLAINLLGDALRDYLDPRTRRG